MLELSETDIRQIREMGKTPEEVKHQILKLRKGPLPVQLTRPCSKGDGVVILSEADERRLGELFEREQACGRASKFVAASGAATRMFEFLHPLFGRQGGDSERIRAEAVGGSSWAVQSLEFFENLRHFAFVEQLNEVLSERGLDCGTLLTQGRWHPIVKSLLRPAGLNYAALPKGLLLFHRYQDGSRSAMEEHVREAVGYLKDGQNRVRVHFTVSPRHRRSVEEHLSRVAEKLEENGLVGEIDCSVQDKATDSIALDVADNLFRTRDGRLLFRPAGHGALLQNLQQTGGDIVFIRTIDNVLHERYHPHVTKYKRVLGGYLVFLREKIFEHLEALDSGPVTESRLFDVERFARFFLAGSPNSGKGASTLEDRRRCWMDKLNRPLRVCGVVRHRGEPGGAPFWVVDRDGVETLQIVEQAQVDRRSEEQRRIFESSSYFNPVDMACGLRDFRGKRFDLSRFCDPETGFVVVKSWKGRELKTLELPGLWNGGMAHWNTVFVEVPGSTLQPVKTVLDLLKEPHRPEE